MIEFLLSRQSDEKLMSRASQGSERAFEELYNRYALRLKGFFVRQKSCRHIADDLTQDVFLRAYAARHTWRDGKNVEAWLFSIAYNLCRNTWRHQQVEERWMDENYKIVAEESATSNVEIDIDRASLDRALREILESLSDENRVLFSLRYEEEQSIAVIADIIHIPEGTVKSRLHNIMKNIKSQLKRYEY